MKKILTILAIICLAACSNPIETVKEPQKETTLEILSKIDTSKTYHLSFDRETVYAFHNNEMVYKLESKNKDNLNIDEGGFVFMVIVIIALFFVVLIEITR